ncbi:MAG: ABC transporter permease [Anaerolineales bacterium]
MTAYILRRLAFLALTVFITSLLIFVITQLLPGDVCRVILGREVGEGALEACRADLGLDQPAPVRYFTWLGEFLRGDWGSSYSTDAEILPLVVDRLNNSMQLGALTLLIAVPISVALGVMAALNAGRWADNMISIFSLAVVGLPEFVTGVLLIQFFGFPSIRGDLPFFEAVGRLLLPALTATFVLLAYVARLTRAGVLEELRQAYVRTAVLKGLPRRVVIWKHVLRNALLPTITVVAISFGWLISGLVVVENVFNYPGLGRLMVFAITRRDLPLLQAISLITVLGFALANLAADLLYAALNPRIRVGS